MIIDDTHSDIAAYRRQLREGLLSPADFRALLRDYASPDIPELWSDPPRYDQADLLLDQLLQIEASPAPLQPITSEMIPYQATPARIVLDMLDRLGLTSDDVFYDI